MHHKREQLCQKTLLLAFGEEQIATEEKRIELVLIALTIKGLFDERFESSICFSFQVPFSSWRGRSAKRPALMQRFKASLLAWLPA
jgi:hypothetical protein